MSNVEIHKEVMLGNPGEWRLCFQWATFHCDTDPPESGYRFIWRYPDGKLQPARGQARIPSASDMFELISRATAAGWFVAAEKPDIHYDSSEWTGDEIMSLAGEAAEALDAMDKIDP